MLFFKCGVLDNRYSFNNLTKRFVVVIVSTNLALSDIPCILFPFLSDTYVGHILHFLSFLSDTSSFVGQI